MLDDVVCVMLIGIREDISFNSVRPSVCQSVSQSVRLTHQSA